MTDLDKLIAAVEAGTWDRDWRKYLVDEWGMARAQYFSDAFGGSLDAAKRLHDALVPEWTAVELRSRNGRKRWVAELSKMDGEQQVYEIGYNPDPARAWLLVILLAVKAKEATP